MKRTSKLFLTEPELAALGSVAAESAYLESILDDGIKRICRISDKQYEIFMAGAMMAKKLDMLLALAELRLKSKRRKKRLAEIISQLKHLNSERVIAIHGLWEPIYEEAPAHVVGIIARAMAAKRIGAKARNAKTNEVSSLTSQRLDGLAQSIHENSGALYGFITDAWTHLANKKKLVKALLKSRSRPAAP